MNNNHRFFCNSECEYFPCHNHEPDTPFNCLFCFCPLYPLGERCRGNFVYLGKVKDCSGCLLPHTPEYYDNIVSKLKDLLE